MNATKNILFKQVEQTNIHHVTVDDFRELARAKGAKIENAWFFAGEKKIGAAAANWRAEFAVFQLSC